MKRLNFILATTLPGFVLLAAAVAGQTPPVRPDPPSAARAKENKTKRVWTNDDVAFLREKSGVSVVGSAPEDRPGKAKSAAAADTKEPSVVKEKDPAWYREQFAPLQARLSEIDGQISELQQYRAITRYMVGGVIIPQLAGLPLNPADQIKQLDVERRDVVRQIDALEDLARRNEVPPGDIR